MVGVYVYYVISKILLSAVIKSTIHDVLRVLGPKNHDEASLRVHIFRSLFETFERYDCNSRFERIQRIQ